MRNKINKNIKFFVIGKSGSTIVEFSLIAPILIILLLGIIQYSWLLMSNLMIVNATSVGVRSFSAERGFSTPYSSTITQILEASPYIGITSNDITIKVDGTTCSSDSACATALSNAQGKSASVSLYYSYTPILLDFMSQLMPDAIRASAAARIQ